MKPDLMLAALDDPVEGLLRFHRRIERELAALGCLSARLAARDVDVEASATAAALVQFFSVQVPLHHEAEERGLLPLLDCRTARSAEAFHDARERLESDHREMESAWRGLKRPLEALGEGVHRSIPEGLVQYFRALHALHIPAEENAVHRLASHIVLTGDRELLARRIRALRLVTESSRH